MQLAEMIEMQCTDALLREPIAREMPANARVNAS